MSLKINVSTESFQKYSKINETAPLLTEWFCGIMYACYLATFVVGVVGNILVCTVIIIRRNRRGGIHLLTLNLAMSDLIVLLLYLPAEIYQIESKWKWSLGIGACQMIYAVNSITLNASIGTLIVITRDRYIAVINPMSIQQRSTFVIKQLIVVVWVVSILLAVPLFLVVDVKSGFCVEIWPSKKLSLLYWITILVLQLVLPSFFLTVTYSIIIKRLRLKSDDLHHVVLMDRTDDKRRYKISCAGILRKKQQKQMLKMSIFLVVAYVLCVSPQHTFYFLILGYPDIAEKRFTPYIITLANFMMILNSALNPTIYGVLNDEIKRSIPAFFACKSFINGRGYYSCGTRGTSAREFVEVTEVSTQNETKMENLSAKFNGNTKEWKRKYRRANLLNAADNNSSCQWNDFSPVESKIWI